MEKYYIINNKLNYNPLSLHTERTMFFQFRRNNYQTISNFS